MNTHIIRINMSVLEKARGGKLVRKAIKNVMTSTETFRKFGIL